jgi:hypothetical protein
VTDYRNPDLALAAKIETLDAERAELDAELARVLAELEQARAEKAALDAAARAADSAARVRRLARVLEVALLAPAVAGFSAMIALPLLLFLLGLPFGNKGFTAAFVLCAPIGAYVGYRFGRNMWRKAASE